MWWNSLNSLWNFNIAVYIIDIVIYLFPISAIFIDDHFEYLSLDIKKRFIFGNHCLKYWTSEYLFRVIYDGGGGGGEGLSKAKY